jgi:hypothetical protein
MHESQMSKAFFSIMSVDPMPAWYRTMWMASPGVVFLPSVEKIDCVGNTGVQLTVGRYGVLVDVGYGLGS